MNRKGYLQKVFKKKRPLLYLPFPIASLAPAFRCIISRAIPGARLHVMHGGGHAFTKTRAEEFNRMALEFLQEEM